MHQWGPPPGGSEEVPARQPGGGQRRDQRQHQAPPHRGHRRGGRAVYNQVKSEGHLKSMVLALWKVAVCVFFVSMSQLTLFVPLSEPGARKQSFSYSLFILPSLSAGEKFSHCSAAIQLAERRQIASD